jgi:catechol 2,3-dioxygenase-like lactoylglutathione lyase family enzyme
LATTFHHFGICTSDVQRAGDFYVNALGGRWMVKPILLDGPLSEKSLGVAGPQLKLALVGFGDAAVELFEIVGEAPAWAKPDRERRLPHLCLHVDDTDATLAKMEELGGRRVWEEVDRMGSARVIYAWDPDGNLIELLSRPASYLANIFHRVYPESMPAELTETAS